MDDEEPVERVGLRLSIDSWWEVVGGVGVGLAGALYGAISGDFLLTAMSLGMFGSVLGYGALKYELRQTESG